MNFTDPLLNDRNFSIPELEREQEAMQQKIAEMKRNYRQSAQTTSSPVWDEIDRIMDSLTEKEFRFMQENEEFQQSSMEIVFFIIFNLSHRYQNVNKLLTKPLNFKGFAHFQQSYQHIM